MRRLNKLTDRQIDDLFEGRTPAGEESLGALAEQLGELKSAVQEIPEELAAVHISLIAAAAQELPAVAGVSALDSKPKETTWRGKIVSNRAVLLTTKLGAVFVGASMLMGGAAFAGADLPDGLAKAFEKAGVTLPNQSHHENGGGNSVSGYASSDAEKGCEFGQSVAALAKQAADAKRQDQAHRQDKAQDDASSAKTDDPCAEEDEGSAEAGANAKGSRATGTTKSAEGRAKANDASGGKSSAGADNAATGQEKSSTAPKGSQDTGTGQEKSSTAPKGSQDTGSEKSSTAPKGGSDRVPSGEETSDE
jgi:hypothetical protein